MGKTQTTMLDEHDRRRKLQLARDGALKARDAAAFLGISESRVYDLRKAGVLTSAIVGGKIVFPRQALVEYLAAQTKTGSIA